ncbi:hypothetical protein JCM8547_008310 [Rhodosporidiobolus lusitaniae]
MASTAPLHNPLVRLPRGHRTPDHIPHAVNPLTSFRSSHVVRLYNLLLHLLTLPPSPRTSTQIVRAWRALAACREVHLMVLWRVGAAVIDRTREGREDEDDEDARKDRANQRAEWLKFCQDGKEERVDKFHEYCLALVAAGKVDFALDELDAYLDNQPYHDSIALNTLYGLLALLLAQLPPSDRRSTSPSAASSSSASSSDEKELYGRKKEKKRAGKRAKLDRADSSDDGYGALLRSMAANSPIMFTKARERFKRAVRLEERQAKEAKLEDLVPGEAARWLALIQKHLDKPPSRDSSADSD